MIRYPCNPKKLREAIAGLPTDWFARSKVRHERNIASGKFVDASPIWSEVKSVFIDLQHRKCVYCERQLEGSKHPIEYDVEHFRPKSSVKKWPAAGDKTYAFSTGAESVNGYYWLAYDIGNYAASCKDCNTPLKSNYFPIAGPRATKPTPISKLAREKPLLCYPIGADDPAQLISFRATVAVPAASDGIDRWRGEVIIDFFKLNERDQLHVERARMLVILGYALQNLAGGGGDATDQGVVDSCLSSAAPHAACSRAFKILWDSDRALARDVFKECKVFVAKNSEPGLAAA